MRIKRIREGALQSLTQLVCADIEPEGELLIDFLEQCVADPGHKKPP